MKKELDRIAIGMKYSSVSTVPAQRRFYYFWGAPGVGKTTAARELAIFLGIPMYETNIRTGADISQQALEGVDGLKLTANLGHLTRAITTSNRVSSKQELKKVSCCVKAYSEYGLDPNFVIDIPVDVLDHTYRNSILVINDFDRLLLDGKTTTQTLAFFLDYLDPGKETFFSSYFGLPISMRDLTIIITGNNPIPQPTSDHNFEALRDRVVEVEFEEFSLSQRREILQRFLNEIKNKLKLGVIDDEEDIIAQASQPKSIRAGKKIIEGCLLDRKKQNPVDIGASTITQSVSPVETVNPVALPEYQLSTVVNFVLPPLCDDPDAIKKIESIKGIAEDTRLLLSNKQFEQDKGANNLLGKTRRLRNLSGRVEGFWNTKSIFRRSKYIETKGGLGALANRLARFVLPEQKHEAMEFHIQTLQFLADALLKIKMLEEDKIGEGYVYNMFKNDEYKKGNLKAFIEHFEKFSDLENLKEDFKQLSQQRELEEVHLGKETERSLTINAARF